MTSGTLYMKYDGLRCLEVRFAISSTVFKKGKMIKTWDITTVIGVVQVTMRLHLDVGNLRGCKNHMVTDLQHLKEIPQSLKPFPYSYCVQGPLNLKVRHWFALFCLYGEMLTETFSQSHRRKKLLSRNVAFKGQEDCIICIPLGGEKNILTSAALAHTPSSLLRNANYFL